MQKIWFGGGGWLLREKQKLIIWGYNEKRGRTNLKILHENKVKGLKIASFVVIKFGPPVAKLTKYTLGVYPIIMCFEAVSGRVSAGFLPPPG